ncbi:MAG: glycogen debranching enzyme family protein [Planctomycetes bacterium]|nr:glycogen debranching enzyme family protein [Planctomycetota bacterium]MCB9935881.1 glycogen debranching enzyme family protein [Planctomycetota bacterium]
MHEWIRTNRLGSFAMGTPQRLPERKYHGLLVLRRAGLIEPLHVLSDVNEVIVSGGKTFELASWHYANTDHPRGFEHQKAFNPAGPSWQYECGEVTLVRSLELAPDRNELRIHYHLNGAAPGAELRLSPLFTARGVHQLAYENPFLDGRAHPAERGVQFRLYRELPAIDCLCEPAAEFVPAGFWNRKVKYPEEARRGYPDQEDLFCPGYFRVALQADTRLTFTLRLPGEAAELSAEPGQAPEFADPAVQDFADALARAASQFVYHESASGQPGIIAGYPWFGEWGRDTLIALPGLLLETGCIELAAAILDRFAACRRDGLIPNLLGDSPESSDWFSVDASLWFIRAVQDLHTRAGKSAAGRWFPVVFDILDKLRNGTPGVCVSDNGLLSVDLRPRPGTWMDAQIDGHAVTPRAPFAVELNALFFNAVQYALRLARQDGEVAFLEGWSPVQALLEDNFERVFWLEDAGYLADSYDGVNSDVSLRPNQLLAASLPFKLISRPHARRMLEAVTRELRTPFGLRTLAPGHELYRGQISGKQAERDRAYHNGTVWPWLLGPYVDAVEYALGEQWAREEITRIAEDFRPHLDDACVGQVSEIFDGDAPYTPRGAPAQAWSVAELLRVVCRHARRSDERSRRASKVLSGSSGAATR